LNQHARAVSIGGNRADRELEKRDGFFGQGGDPNNIAKNSYSVANNSVTSGGKVPGTTEILFLKRLLYLKASIDNESTLNTFSVPFEQEKVRDLATPDQLLLDTQAVLSGGRETRQAVDSGQLNQINR
jgi:hypothetical protein